MNHPITHALLFKLEAELEQMNEAWGVGVFTGDTNAKTAQLNAEALGKIDAMCIELDWLHLVAEDIKYVKEGFEAYED